MIRIMLFVCLMSVCLSSNGQDCAQTIKRYQDQRTKDSLNIIAQKYRVNRVAYYVKIVDKNPSQIKYLKGWVKRAIR